MCRKRALFSSPGCWLFCVSLDHFPSIPLFPKSKNGKSRLDLCFRFRRRNELSTIPLHDLSFLPWMSSLDLVALALVPFSPKRISLFSLASVRFYRLCFDD